MSSPRADTVQSFVLTFTLNSWRRPEGRPELLGAAVAARRHVVRYLKEWNIQSVSISISV